MNEQLFDADFYKKLNTLKLNMKIRLNRGASGGRKSNAKGSSLEFSDFREYMLGDDIRHIDWNAYGRTDKLLVKLFMEEKEGRFRIFLDTSRSMDFGNTKKSVYASRTAAALSYIILNNLDRVFLTTMQKETIYTSKGLTGSQSFGKIIRQLEEADLSSATEMNEMIPWERLQDKGVSIIISDFFMKSDIEELVRKLAYKRQEIILIQVLAEEELNPQFEGTWNLLDAESPEQMKITMGTKVMKNYYRELDTFTNHIKNVCRRYGASYICASTGKPLDQLFFESLGKTGVLI